MKIITFKSVDPYYLKEESGMKNNTIRAIKQDDDRLKAINNFISGEHGVNIKIENPITNKSFIRTVKDISQYKSLYIITWEVE